jgi:hypothetical protein
MTRQLAALAAVVGLLTTACSVGIAANTDRHRAARRRRPDEALEVRARDAVGAGRPRGAVRAAQRGLPRARVHRRGRRGAGAAPTGTEPAHDERATEVDVPGEATVTTTVTFAVPGSLTFTCHVTGHYAYGMVGTLTVM